MDISYTEALAAVKRRGNETATARNSAVERISLRECLNRITVQDICSPIATPPFDNSAMDGYAVSSILAANASESNPILLRVLGTIAAGDKPIRIPNIVARDGSVPCIEIMTGASFPSSSDSTPDFDACIPYEQVQIRSGSIQITRPPKPNQHRRPAGDDFAKGQRIVLNGTVLRPSHIMALASTGLDYVLVRSKLRALLFSTGNELSHGDSTIPKRKSHGIFDANGPFLEAALSECGVHVEFAGIVSDGAQCLASKIKTRLQNSDISMILTTGGVSAGKFDCVRNAIELLGAHIVFHKVKVRPGHPTLFATLERLDTSESVSEERGRDCYRSDQKIAFFALPGNPIACAAMFRFLVVPYIMTSSGQSLEKDVKGTLCGQDNTTGAVQRTSSSSAPRDTFKHGMLELNDHGIVNVRLSAESGSAKTRPFAQSNCWVHIPRGCPPVGPDDFVKCVSLCGSQQYLEL